jgi:hypothetical protein
MISNVDHHVKISRRTASNSGLSPARYTQPGPLINAGGDLQADL